mmetsp:Transcript_2933/g.5435  ORF Transcript_2933/g.5435 Transcript_2933/m.5435 type:complete len:320 (-) Transcript_2933:196-1155(-)
MVIQRIVIVMLMVTTIVLAVMMRMTMRRRRESQRNTMTTWATPTKNMDQSHMMTMTMKTATTKKIPTQISTKKPPSPYATTMPKLPRSKKSSDCRHPPRRRRRSCTRNSPVPFRGTEKTLAIFWRSWTCWERGLACLEVQVVAVIMRMTVRWIPMRRRMRMVAARKTIPQGAMSNPVMMTMMIRDRKKRTMMKMRKTRPITTFPSPIDRRPERTFTETKSTHRRTARPSRRSTSRRICAKKWVKKRTTMTTLRLMTMTTILTTTTTTKCPPPNKWPRIPKPSGSSNVPSITPSIVCRNERWNPSPNPSRRCTRNTPSTT